MGRRKIRCVLFSNCAIYLMWFIYPFKLTQRPGNVVERIACQQFYTIVYISSWVSHSSFNPNSVRLLIERIRPFHLHQVVGIEYLRVDERRTIQLKPISGRTEKKNSAVVCYWSPLTQIKWEYKMKSNRDIHLYREWTVHLSYSMNDSRKKENGMFGLCPLVVLSMPRFAMHAFTS